MRDEIFKPLLMTTLPELFYDTLLAERYCGRPIFPMIISLAGTVTGLRTVTLGLDGYI